MADQKKLRLTEPAEFRRRLNKLGRHGGLGHAVIRQVHAALHAWHRGEDPKLPLTHHGEKRILHVVKYDLKGRFRLIVREHEGERVPLMVGSHDECEEWLQNNQGKDFVIDSSKRISLAPADHSLPFVPSSSTVLQADNRSGSIIALLPDHLINQLNIPASTLRTIHSHVTYEAEASPWDLLSSLTFPSERLRNVVISVIGLLADCRDQEAIASVKSYLGDAESATDNPRLFSEAIDSGLNTDTITDLSRLSDVELGHRFDIADANRTTDLLDWMLYPHPQQHKLIEREYQGPARVIGVSGSGKTCVLVHRARRLAKKYPGERVLILSLNASLCKLIREMVDRLCESVLLPQIEVITIHEYCTRVVNTVHPDRLLRNKDPRSGETLALAWRDFMQKRHAKVSADPLVNALESRGQYLDGRMYLFEELAWVRSGFGIEERLHYLACERHGRGVPLPKSMLRDAGEDSEESFGLPRDARQRVLVTLRDYEEYMEAGGLADVYEVPLAAFSLRHEIAKHENLQSRCVLVDEVQDCSTVELGVISRIPTKQENGLYLTGDPVQKVLPKQHDFPKAGVSIVGRGEILRLNYRNSKQILKAGYRIIDHFRGLAPIDDADILEPEYAYREGPLPILYSCASAEQQLELVLWYISHQSAEEFSSTCIGSPNEDCLRRFEVACKAKGWQTFTISGEFSREGRVGEGIKLSLLGDLKGFEFRQVYLVDLSDVYLMPKGAAWEERWRNAFQLYVAMTRARDELIMSHCGVPSLLLQPLEDFVEQSVASELL